MQLPSLNSLKKELQHRDSKELIDLVLHLSKLNRDNKAFLYFKLFDSDDASLFVDTVKEELEKAFNSANSKNYYFAKKSAQGIRRILNKNLKLTKDSNAKIELITFFCRQLEEFGYLEYHYPVIDNLYALQVGKVEKLIGNLHEDLQFDYQEQLENLKKPINQIP
ncbi:hypothetical protein [Cyclobacterium jeungdonense]|uniref:Uncharacterized protein n=1 Tax=Cyclobacterium jeungdonense TaxID=708087 RepID=A0ABT8CED1_9BACT|nr:hypothetical protein [Cyclobacterium jeungdonense]MDN3690138.1 hypothetical protein [Cyclobacterium jeungdonense]